MCKIKRRYNKEFKVKACELVLKEGIKCSVVAEKPGISAIMLSRWIDEYQTLGEDAFVGTGHQRPKEARLKRLEKENERLRMENEILKKQRHTLRATPRTNSVCEEELAGYDTSQVCRILQVSRNGYYRKGKTIPSEEIALEKAVIHCFAQHHGNYGRICIRK